MTDNHESDNEELSGLKKWLEKIKKKNASHSHWSKHQHEEAIAKLDSLAEKNSIESQEEQDSTTASNPPSSATESEVPSEQLAENNEQELNTNSKSNENPDQISTENTSNNSRSKKLTSDKQGNSELSEQLGNNLTNIVSNLNEEEKQNLVKEVEKIDKIKSNFSSLESQILEQNQVLMQLLQIQNEQHAYIERQTHSLEKHLRKQREMEAQFGNLKRNFKDYKQTVDRAIRDAEQAIKTASMTTDDRYII